MLRTEKDNKVVTIKTEIFVIFFYDMCLRITIFNGIVLDVHRESIFESDHIIFHGIDKSLKVTSSNQLYNFETDGICVIIDEFFCLTFLKR